MLGNLYIQNCVQTFQQSELEKHKNALHQLN